MNKQLFTGISKAVCDLWEKIKNIDYEKSIGFSLTVRLNDNNEERITYCIRTPSIADNYFNNKEELKEFIKTIPSNLKQLKIERIEGYIKKFKKEFEVGNKTIKIHEAELEMIKNNIKGALND